MSKKTDKKPTCSLCGSPTALESGLIRCQDKNCRHTMYQGYAFQKSPTHYPEPYYPPYERINPKEVDEEFK